MYRPGFARPRTGTDIVIFPNAYVHAVCPEREALPIVKKLTLSSNIPEYAFIGI